MADKTKKNIYKQNKEVITHEKTNTHLRTRAYQAESLFVCENNFQLDSKISSNQNNFSTN